MSHEFERNINRARERQDVKAINAWTALHGIFDILVQTNVISELPKLEIISTDASLSETKTSTESVENDLVIVNGAKLRELRQQMREFRRKASFTQFEVAKFIGIGQGFISEIETGRRQPKIPGSVAIRLAELYQTELTTFIPNPEEIKKVEQLRKTLREKGIK